MDALESKIKETIPQPKPKKAAPPSNLMAMKEAKQNISPDPPKKTVEPPKPNNVQKPTLPTNNKSILNTSAERE